MKFPRMNPVGIWFGSKRIGWGLSPRTWEGWLVTFGVVAVGGVVAAVARRA